MSSDLTALIYTRVSSSKQKTQGSGNESQEIRCREFAKQNGWLVSFVFEDTFTGAGDFMNRPAMRDLINYVKNNTHKKFVVVFDDLKRLSRDTVAFITLIALFKDLDVRIECLNHKFEDTPEGEFIRTILAAHGQLERKQNARQVTQKTEAHLLNGDWPYKAPNGYTATNITGNKIRICFINETGKGIQMGLRGFASGRFKTISELARYFCENKYIINRSYNGAWDITRSMLQNAFFAGYVHKPEKGVVMVKGKHEAMITLEEHETNLKRLEKEISGEKQYQLFRDDFELRQLVRCSACGRKLRSAKSKGRSKYYYYYTCRIRGCLNENINISSTDLHNQLYATLRSIESSEEVVRMGTQAFSEALEEVIKEKGLHDSEIQKTMDEINTQLEVLINSITKIQNEIALRGIEAKIEELDMRRKVLEDKKSRIVTIDNKSRTAFKEMSEFLISPYKIWHLCDSQQKRTLYRYIFAEDFTYDPKTERRTISLSPIYSYLQDIQKTPSHDKEVSTVVVPPEGIEPSTVCLKGSCSTD